MHSFAPQKEKTKAPPLGSGAAPGVGASRSLLHGLRHAFARPQHGVMHFRGGRGPRLVVATGLPHHNYHCRVLHILPSSDETVVLFLAALLP